MDAKASSSGIEQHRQQIRTLAERYGTSGREYPVEVQKVVPVPRDGAANRLIYQSRRGYWITTLIDHDHIAEQLIRTGDRMGATYSSIQQAIYYYTQGSVQLTGEAANIWKTAFPELETELTPTPYPYGDCMHFVTVVTSNLSAYSAGRSISVGDILAAKNPSLPLVVAAEDLNFNVSPNTPDSKRTLRVYPMSQQGKPSQQSEYVKVINHSSQLEQAIRIGVAERYHPCAIQEVILYINGEIPSLTIGKGLWDRLSGGAKPSPTPPVPTPGYQSVCLGNPTTRPGKMASMTFKNLAVLVGMVVPFGLIMRRKKRRD
jgi:hypothetical protein